MAITNTKMDVEERAKIRLIDAIDRARELSDRYAELLQENPDSGVWRPVVFEAVEAIQNGNKPTKFSHGWLKKLQEDFQQVLDNAKQSE